MKTKEEIIGAIIGIIMGVLFGLLGAKILEIVLEKLEKRQGNAHEHSCRQHSP